MHSENPGQAALPRLAGSRVVGGVILATLFSLLSLQDAAAHDPGLSSLTIRLGKRSLQATLTLAVKDAAQLAELDENHAGTVTQVEFGRSQERLEAAVGKEIVIAADSKVCKPEFIRSYLDQNNNVEVRLDFGPVVFSSLEIQSNLVAPLPFGHRQYLEVQDLRGQTIGGRLLSAASNQATVQMPRTKASVAAFEIVRSFANFLSLGVKHILTGYDHLLFLFGLLIVARGVFSSLRASTAIYTAEA